MYLYCLFSLHFHLWQGLSRAILSASVKPKRPICHHKSQKGPGTDYGSSVSMTYPESKRLETKTLGEDEEGQHQLY